MLQPPEPALDTAAPARESWLGNEAAFWPVLAALLGTTAVLKGLRMPSAWALTQAQLDYSQGFIKRGLLGATYGALGLQHRLPLSAAFFVELGLLFLLMIVFTRRAGLIQRCGTGAIAALFAGSYAITFLTHIVGYNDIPNAVLALALLLIRDPKARFLAALPLFAIALLIHENFLFLAAPMVLFSFFLDGIAAPPKRRQVWTYGVALALLAGALTLATSLRPPMSDDRIDAMQAHAEAHVDFELRDDFFQILGNSLGDNIAQVSELGWHRYLWWTYMAVSVCVLLPVVLLLVHFCLRLLRTSNDFAMPKHWIVTALSIAIFSPLVMHLLGLDQVRWNTWVTVNAYLALGLLCRHLPGAPLRVSPAERNAIILAIALSMASGHGFFDGATVNPYPFFPKVLWPAIHRHDGPIPGF